MRRTCQPCQDDRKTHLGDGSYGAFTPEGFAAYMGTVFIRRDITGRKYELDDNALTPDSFRLVRDINFGHVCESCRTPFNNSKE